MLTGSTGFLGQALLHALVAEQSIKVVHCLAVRNATTRSDELLTQMRSNPKILIHSGDLTLPRLGLDEDTAQKIFSAADTVIHNGADVSYLKSYETLRLANVESTKELAALCLPRRIKFHYVSTAGVSTFAAMRHGTDYEFAATSAADFLPPDNFDLHSIGSGPASHNYMAMTATKWASEGFLERAVVAADGTWHVHIHRPSLIVRPEEDQNAASDISWNIRHYSQRLQAIPLIKRRRKGGITGSRLNLVRPEQVVQGIINDVLSQADTCESRSPYFRHYLGDTALGIDDLKSLVSGSTPGKVELGVGDGRPDCELLPEMPIEEWVPKACNVGMSSVVGALLTSLETSEDIVFPKILKS